MSIVYPLPKEISEDEFDIWRNMPPYRIEKDGFKFEIIISIYSNTLFYNICIETPENPFITKNWSNLHEVFFYDGEYRSWWCDHEAGYSQNRKLDFDCRFPELANIYGNSQETKRKIREFKTFFTSFISFSNLLPRKELSLVFFLCMNRIEKKCLSISSHLSGGYSRFNHER